ncbi:GlcG/HbpS family heme-binding protein [Maribacter ulvicola]|uniref:Uncharacterized conserved protein GlcG, DUF336 family n=1 Tax=Maribacter ulvicola TaxID=228959 RepID=A0A1N6QT27_9FLAO|nr:heme-binding protein [Maribacter ulvicola]SIQ19747.1 Uncharacterized conserved protein GlcG, DUF336 family [Maribacter ulvicola]
MKSNKLYFLVVFTFLYVSAATAQDNFITQTNISTEGAMKIAQVAYKECKAQGFNAIITVVDAKGLMKTQIVMDGSFPHAIKTSSRKAYTAASRKKATHLLQEVTGTEHDIAMTFNAIEMTTLSGGVPIIKDGQVVGAIGISGAPGENEKGEDYDVLIANKAIKSIFN